MLSDSRWLRSVCIALLSKNKNQHVCCRVQRSSSDFQCSKCSEHLALKLLVVVVERMKGLGWTTALGPTHSGQDRFDHLLAQDLQRHQRADAGSAHSIAPRFTDSLYQRLAAQLVQIIRRLAG